MNPVFGHRHVPRPVSPLVKPLAHSFVTPVIAISGVVGLWSIPSGRAQVPTPAPSTTTSTTSTTTTTTASAAPTATATPTPSARVKTLTAQLSSYDAWKAKNRQIAASLARADEFKKLVNQCSDTAVSAPRLKAMQNVADFLRDTPLAKPEGSPTATWYENLVTARTAAPKTADFQLATDAVLADETDGKTFGAPKLTQVKHALALLKHLDDIMPVKPAVDDVQAALAHFYGIGKNLTGKIEVPVVPTVAGAPAGETEIARRKRVAEQSAQARDWLGGDGDRLHATSGSLPAMREAVSFAAQLQRIPNFATSAEDAAYAAFQDALNDKKTEIKTQVGALLPLFTVVLEDARDAVPAIATYVSKLDEVDRPEPDAPSILRSTTVALRQLRSFQNDWTPFEATLQREAAAQFKTELPKLKQSVRALQVSRQLLSQTLELVEQGAAGESEAWISVPVRLFYFSDVSNLLNILNPNKVTLNGEASDQARQQAKLTRAELVTAEADLAESLNTLGQARRRKKAIQEEIRQAKATRDQTTRLSDRQTRLLAALETDKTKLTTEKTELGEEIEAATPQNAAEEANLASKKVRFIALTKRLQVLGDRFEVQSKIKGDTDDAKTEADSAYNELISERDGLPSALAAAETGLSDAQTQVLRLRRASRTLAQQEVEDFAASRDTRPLFRTTVNADNSSATHRVAIYAFEDSKTLLLRGLPRDVEVVKNIIAGIDRPAPQARITLWTLQLNSGDANRMNRSLSVIDSGLRNLRGNVTLVQDLLRNSINKEVNRQERIAAAVSKSAKNAQINAKKPGVYEGRMGRYFFYPSEIRLPLGMPGTLPDVPEELVIAAEELEASLQYFQRAREKNIAAKGYRRGDDKAQKRSDRNNLLRYSGYHLRQGLFALERLEVQDRKYQAQIRQNPGLMTDLGLGDFDTRAVVSLAFVSEITALIQKGETDDDVYEELLNKPAKFAKIAGSVATSSPVRTAAGFEVFAQETLQRLRAALKTSWELDGAKTGKDLPSDADLQQAEAVTRFTLPDPAQGTTLGEMLFILSLGKRRARERILDNLQLSLNEAYNASGGGDSNSRQNLLNFAESLDAAYGDADEPGQSRRARSRDGDGLYPNFPRTVMGAFRSKVPIEGDNHEMTSNQLEIFTAIQTKARANAAAEVRRLLRQIQLSAPAPSKIGSKPDVSWAKDDALQEIRARYVPLVDWLSKKSLGSSSRSERETAELPQGQDLKSLRFGSLLKNSKNAVQAQIEDKSTANIALSSIRNENSAPPQPNASLSDALLDRLDVLPSQLIAMDRSAWTIATQEADLNSLARATPRVAAADDMIKRFITVTEDDLEHFFFEDALKNLRKALPDGVQLGAIQRESVLATNRLVARVDLDANADVQFDAGTDFLQETTQLAQLAQGLKEDRQANALSSGLTATGLAKLAGNSAKKSFGLGGALGLLGALSTQPRETGGEVYSINSGNLFKVTPIFDPSGQAMRFKFDFTSSVRVQEADGSTNPAIPRVERHSVNTEVQLSNLEIREVSRFENNAKLGIPKKKTGGVPFLRTLPLIKDIPLLGYFTKEGGSRAVAQQSLILAQTTVYPTVSEIIDLMVAEPPLIDLDPQKPAYLELGAR